MRRWLAAVLLMVLASPVQAAGVLVGHWNFDEGQGATAMDSSGGANHGTVEGAAWIKGAQGSHALRFSEFGHHVDMGDRSDLEPATLTVSVCTRSPVAPGRWKYLVSEGLEGICTCASYALFTAPGGHVQFYTCTGSVSSVSAQIPASSVWDGWWHRVVGTYDGASVRIFMDGEAVGDPVAAVAPNYSLSVHSDFWVGAVSCVGAIQADIDEVSVWQGVLSDAEIAELGDCRFMEDGFESNDTSGWAVALP